MKQLSTSLKLSNTNGFVKAKIIFISFIASFIFNTSIYAQSYTDNDKIFYISQIWKDALCKFHSPEYLNTIHWDSLYVSSLKKAISCQNDDEYYLIMREFLAKLDDGHSDLNYNNFNYSKTDFIPIDLKSVNNDYYILGVENSLVEKVPLGSKIIKVNNMPIQEYLDRYIMQYSFGHTLRDRIRRALPLLCSSIKTNDSLTCQIKTPKGQIREVVLKYDALKRNIHRKDMIGTKFSSINYSSSTGTYLTKDNNRKDYYYLRLDDFDKSQISNTMHREESNILKAKYIVLDLRHNTGGSELEADSLLMCFLKLDTLVTYKSLTRKDNAFFSAMGYGYPQYKDYYKGLAMDTLPADTLYKKDLPLFTQPLFVLIGEDTYSAAEDFLITLKLHFPKRAILIGMPTGGSTGAPFVRNLPYHHSSYRICTRKPCLPKGLFDNGIQPDIYYEMNIEDHLKGTDRIYNIIEQTYKKMEATKSLPQIR